jgi:two-component system, NtrC family, response regulator AtoC
VTTFREQREARLERRRAADDGAPDDLQALPPQGKMAVMRPVPDATISLAARDGSDGAYLLIVEGATSAMLPLPREGTLTIGRAEDCDVRLNDAACSRRQARLHLRDGAVTLEDLGSHNGTLVNGEPLVGSRLLVCDDIVAVGPVKLVVHATGSARPTAAFDGPALRERLIHEVERAVSYERPLSVAAIAVDSPAARDALLAELLPSLRPVDIAGRVDDRHVVIVMPELRPAAARNAASRFTAAVAGAPLRIGLAHCPGDGCRAEPLLAAAREAAPPSGGIREAADCVTELQLDGGTALVADPAMMQLYELLRRLAQSELTILINGETGAGKENAARAVHVWSRRARAPFVAINCASLPEALVESELFGYEKGAFSGAAAAKPGRLESAAGGTLFLDEVGELSLAAQAKLLRALETRRATRLGALKDVALDLRVVADTNRDLVAAVKAGHFREDLYFRLSGAKISLPPLRDRPRELALLARSFLDRAAGEAGRAAPLLSAAAMAALARHPWPGNVRELKNEMEFLAATVTDSTVEPWHLSERLATAADPAAASAPDGKTPVQTRFRPIADELRELERRRMQEALDAAGGVQKRAAELIGMPARTFTMKFKQYGLGER